MCFSCIWQVDRAYETAMRHTYYATDSAFRLSSCCVYQVIDYCTHHKDDEPPAADEYVLPYMFPFPF